MAVVIDLHWIEADPTDADGDRCHVHYLVDRLSSRCFATIAEPSGGHLLYQTDIKGEAASVDRCYIGLNEAKAYCELHAQAYERKQDEEFRNFVNYHGAAPAKKRRWWSWR